jgi:ribosomal protein L3 glutamine methyltransferase
MTRLSHKQAAVTPALRVFAAAPPRRPSVEQLIRFGAREFERAQLVYGHGTDNALDDAAALVFHVLGLSHDDAAAAYPRQPDQRDVERVLDAFESRIVQRLPAAYLMGRMWFAGLEFVVDPRVIVPRSPFAELIDARFAPWIDAGRVRRVLDIGTGSGCIAIACAVRFPDARVDAVDISAAALDVARVNIARHGVQDRVELHRGDVYEPLGDRVYDVIVSNPPYVSDDEMAALPPEYRHEPELALRAGADGLDVVRRILAGAREHLPGHGVLFVEVGDSEQRVRERWPQVPFTWPDFERGGGGVFLLTRSELDAHAAAFARSTPSD